MPIANVSVTVDISVPTNEFKLVQATEDGGIAILCNIPKTSHHDPTVWSSQFSDLANLSLETVLQECAKHIHDFSEEHS